MPVALITGASTGIGLATALHFGRHGHDVWAGVRNPSAATELREGIETERLPVRLVALDVDDAGSVQRGVAEVHGKAGRIDVLVNNAGIGGRRPDRGRAGRLGEDALRDELLRGGARPRPCCLACASAAAARS
jgi:NAD(P)-dependent dehydrogenase (short-subunit alcohol dehydrogenase family)